MKIEDLSSSQREIQDFLKALSGETRQRILLAFYKKERLTVNQVSEYTGIGQSTASEHLAQLKRGGIMSSQREGKQVFYYPDKDKAIAIIDLIKQFILECCG